jgi:hypothetical protein
MKRRAAMRRTVEGALGLAASGALGSCNDRGERQAGGGRGKGKGSRQRQRSDGPSDLSGEIGITTGGFDSQRRSGELTLENLPRFLNGELGMSLIDVNSRWFTSFDRSYVEACRELAVASACHYSNLKVNHSFGNLYATDGEEASQAMREARRMVDVAGWLGARWIRFTIPEKETLSDDLSSHRELMAYAAEKAVRLVVENGGWMRSRADSIALGVEALSPKSVPENPLEASASSAPDTGNWDDDVREEGLARSFPDAVTCDFKVFDLNEDGEHEKYDIQRCFDIGWQAGYRGPWLIEHWNEDTSALVRDLLLLRDQLRGWMRDQATESSASRSGSIR